MRISFARFLIPFLILLNLTPVWFFKYFPTQDGSTHTHTAQAIKDYNKDEYTKFREYYQRNLKPFPNWSAQIILILLMYVFPTLIAEKLLVTIYIVLFSMSAIYLIRSVNERGAYTRISELLCLLFAHNFLLYMGFYSFVLSLPPLLFALGYWWRNRDRIGIKHFLVLCVLCFTTYLAHLVSYVMLIFLIIFLGIPHLVIEFISHRKAGEPAKKHFRPFISFGLVVISMITSLIPMLMYLGKSGIARSYPLLRDLLKGLFPIETLYYISNSQKIVAYPVSVLIILLFLYTLLHDKIRLRESKLEFALTQKDYFLAASFASLVLYIAAPASMSGGGFLSNRLVLYLPLLLLPWISVNYRTILKRAIEAFIVLLCILNISLLYHYVSRFNVVMDEFVSGVELTGRDNLIMGLMRDRQGWFLRVEPYAGGTNYYCIDNGNVNLVNYQADHIYFGINFRQGLNRPDIATLAYNPHNIDFGAYAQEVPYIIAWGLADGSDVEENVLRHYSIIKKTQNLKVFKATSGTIQGKFWREFSQWKA